MVEGEHKSSGKPQSFHSRLGQEGSTGGPEGFKLRKTRALLCRREMVGGGMGIREEVGRRVGESQEVLGHRSRIPG